MVCSSTWSCLS